MSDLVERATMALAALDAALGHTPERAAEELAVMRIALTMAEERAHQELGVDGEAAVQESYAQLQDWLLDVWSDERVEDIDDVLAELIGDDADADHEGTLEAVDDGETHE